MEIKLYGIKMISVLLVQLIFMESLFARDGYTWERGAGALSLGTNLSCGNFGRDSGGQCFSGVKLVSQFHLLTKSRKELPEFEIYPTSQLSGLGSYTRFGWIEVVVVLTVFLLVFLVVPAMIWVVSSLFSTEMTLEAYGSLQYTFDHQELIGPVSTGLLLGSYPFESNHIKIYGSIGLSILKHLENWNPGVSGRFGLGWNPRKESWFVSIEYEKFIFRDEFRSEYKRSSMNLVKTPGTLFLISGLKY